MPDKLYKENSDFLILKIVVNVACSMLKVVMTIDQYSSLNVRFTDGKVYRNTNSSDRILPRRILHKTNRKHAG